MGILVKLTVIIWISTSCFCCKMRDSLALTLARACSFFALTSNCLLYYISITCLDLSSRIFSKLWALFMLCLFSSYCRTSLRFHRSNSCSCFFCWSLNRCSITVPRPLWLRLLGRWKLLPSLIPPWLPADGEFLPIGSKPFGSLELNEESLMPP